MSKLVVPVTASDHIHGEPDAPVTLVEYGDFECPHCAQAHPIVKQLQHQFGNQLRFVFRHFPLAQIHPLAEPAAEAAEFAADHRRFWEMHDAIYENQPDLSLELLLQLAQSLNLSPIELTEALSAHRHLPKVRGDFTGGVRSGVNGTPTFFINGERHNGAWSFEDMVAAIEAKLPERAHR